MRSLRRDPIAFVSSDGLIYVLGGNGGSTVVEAFNPVTKTWVVKRSLLTGVSGTAGCLLGGKYYVFGGFTGYGRIRTVQVYDVAADAWSLGPDLPSAWNDHQVELSTDGLIYIFGQGATWGGITYDCQCWSFDPSTGVYTPRERPTRSTYAPVSASYNGTIYLMGGRMLGSSNAPTSFIEAYNTSWNGAYVSSVYDAGKAVDWGTVGWSSFEPSGTSIAVQTRSSLDGQNWSDWVGDYQTGDQVLSPLGRYIQYRVSLSSDNAPWVPTLGDITISVKGPELIGPSTPMPERPSGAVFDGTPELAWTNSTGGITRSYEVQVDRSPRFDGAGLRTFTDVPELIWSSVVYLPSSEPLPDGPWYWRVRASDGFSQSDWSPATSFDVMTRPDIAVESLTGPDVAEEGAEVALTAVVANHGAPADDCVIRFEDATSGEPVGVSGSVALGFEATASVTVKYPTLGKSGIRSLSASVERPADQGDAATMTLSVTPHGLSATVAPDRMTYSAEETASLVVTAVNGGDVTREAAVSLRVLDSEGVLVEDVGAPVALQIEGGQSTALPFEWNTRSIYPGDYTVQVSIARDGRICTTSEAPIRIAEHVSLGGRVSVDRIAYEVHDRVQVSSRVSNESSNSVFSDLLVKQKVLDPSGAVLASSETTVVQLQRGEAKLYGLAWDVADARPGEYSATEEVVRADGSVLVSGTVGFEVLSSSQSGAGLSAALDVAPGTVHQGEAVTFSYSLVNDGNSDMDIPLTLSIVDPETSGTVLAELTGTRTVVEDGSTQGEFVVDTGDLARVTAAGGTHLLAILQGDIGGYRLTLDNAPITVLPVSAAATIETDASEYDALSAVTMTATVSNTTTGYPLDSVKLHLQVTDPDGTVVRSETRTVAHLAPGEPASERYGWNTALLGPGTYSASVSVTFDGMPMSTSATQFTVLPTSQTGTGLSGQIELEKRDISPGEVLNASFVVRNDGNSDVTPLQMVVVVQDAVTGAQLTEQPCPVDLRRGDIASGTASFPTEGMFGGSSGQLLVRLQARVPRTTKLLDAKDVAVHEGVRLSVTKRLGSMHRVLVWCETAENRHTAEKSLQDIGAYYRIVETPDDFITEMRSGIFDTLVILDTKRPLPAHFDEEVAERVNSGATLIGTRWANMDNFKGQDIFGVSFSGFLPDTLRHIAVPQSVCTTQRQVDTTGKVQKVTAAGAQVISSWSGYPVITMNQRGRGTAVLFGFDVGSVSGDTGSALLTDAIIGCPADEGALGAAEIAVVEVAVQNQGVATVVQVDERVTDAQIVGAVGATMYDADSAQWTRTIGQGEVVVFRYLVRLDAHGATALLTTDASVNRNGELTRAATSQLAVVPSSTSTGLLTSAIVKVTAIATTSKADSQIKERSLKTLRLQQADPPRTWGEYGWAIQELVSVCQDLDRISADTTAARLAVDELMRLYGAGWYQ